jgi:hypothetical protein
MRITVKIAAAVSAVGLAAGLAACSSDPKPQGSFGKLTGNNTTVVFAPSFLSAITGLGVTPSGFGTAKLAKSGGDTTAAFPITGGKATIYKKGDKTPYVQGEVDHSGSGLNLAAGGTTVTMKDFVIDPGNNSKLTGEVDVNGAVAYKSVKLFDLDGSTLKTPSISSDGVATLSGTTIYLSPEAAGALNKTFKLTGSKALPTDKMKIKVGTAIIKATGTA